MLLPSQNGIAPEANNTLQIILLLHVQILCYFNEICDKLIYLVISKKYDFKYLPLT